MSASILSRQHALEQMLAVFHLRRTDRRRHEQIAGHAAACAAAILAAWVMGTTITAAVSSPFEENLPPISIVIEESISEPPLPVPAAPPALKEVGATVVAALVTGVPDAKNDMGLPDEDLLDDAAPEPDKPPSLEDWVPNSDQAVALAGERLRQADAIEGVKRRRGEIADHIQRAAVNAAGREFDLVSDGGMSGIIRTMDFSTVDEDTARRVLEKRYGITIETKHVTPKAGRQFLNAARTRDGTFTNAAQEGIYDVFVLSPKAISIMATLEVSAMMKQGFDPKTTRVREIEFGLIKGEFNDWDLAVINMKAERIR